MKKKKTFKELFAGTGKEPMKLQGTCNLSQTFMPIISNETIKMNSHDFLPNTSIFATTIDGELTDVINIKDCFNRLPKEEKLKVVSVLIEWCASETFNLINQKK
jgi:hypothetical protein